MGPGYIYVHTVASLLDEIYDQKNVSFVFIESWGKSDKYILR